MIEWRYERRKTMTVVWLAAFVVFLAAEALTVSLTSVWFAGGAAGSGVQGCGSEYQLWAQ